MPLVLKVGLQAVHTMYIVMWILYQSSIQWMSCENSVHFK
jgi:hypothetical protein